MQHSISDTIFLLFYFILFVAGLVDLSPNKGLYFLHCFDNFEEPYLGKGYFFNSYVYQTLCMV